LLSQQLFNLFIQFRPLAPPELDEKIEELLAE